ncbi:TGF-beta receptor type-1 [Stylophora pistillata]|uniref:Serine/threonine-protein kinase receptor n=1 Tax=Stylophora pistillata TaxID=50429 RepID=A0A2B4SBV2_STYPI|nr:TGF-beta receptor type-1 [Stylophora pistillata]
MSTSRAFFLIVSTFLQVAKYCSGEANLTQKTGPSHQVIECECSGCEKSQCKTGFGCFSSVRPDEQNQSYVVSRGCLEHQRHFIVKCDKPYHLIVCCKENMCNRNVTPSVPPGWPGQKNATLASPPDNRGVECMCKSTASTLTRFEKVERTNFILLSIFAPIAALVVGIVVVCVVYQLLQKRQLKNGRYPNLRYARHSASFHEDGSCNARECGKCSGSGVSKFSQRTAAQDVDLIQVIGEGKYGKIWRGIWHGDDVVAKLYLPTEEKFFKNEVDVNNKIGNHENILRVQHCHSAFIWNKATYRCIVMEFHENGSLYDFLSRRTVNAQEMCSLALSAARGLNHLHGEIYGRKEKYSIAHCDLKSKNIMVKSNLTCSIGGLGLGVVHDRSQDKIITENKRRGSPRYMSPELLEGGVFKSFESYKRADVYSLGLTLWEITRRTFTEGIRPEHFELPFFDMVPSNPTYDDMKKVVSEQQKRPLVPNKWTESSALEVMGKLMKDCWKQNASARLPSLRVKKTLSKLMEMLKPAPINTSLSESEESSAIQDVNIHIPETLEIIKV